MWTMNSTSDSLDVYNTGSLHIRAYANVVEKNFIFQSAEPGP